MNIKISKKFYNLSISLLSVFYISRISIITLWIGLFNISLLFIWCISKFSFSLKFFIIQELSTICIIIFLILKSEILFFVLLLLKIGIVPLEQWVINFIKKIRNFSLIIFLRTYKILPFFILINILSFLFPVVLFFLLISILKLWNYFICDFLLLIYSSNFINFLLLLISIYSILLTFVLFYIYVLILLSFNFSSLSFILLLISLPPTILFFFKLLSFYSFTNYNIFLFIFILFTGWGFLPYIHLLFKFIFKTLNVLYPILFLYCLFCFLLL